MEIRTLITHAHTNFQRTQRCLRRLLRNCERLASATALRTLGADDHRTQRAGDVRSSSAPLQVSPLLLRHFQLAVGLLPDMIATESDPNTYMHRCERLLDCHRETIIYMNDASKKTDSRDTF